MEEARRCGQKNVRIDAFYNALCVCVYLCARVCVLLGHPMCPTASIGQDGSLDLESRYGCTQPQPIDDDDYVWRKSCGVNYLLLDEYPDTVTIAAVKIGET